MRGLMQDRPLALPHVFHRAEQLFGHKPIVTATANGRGRDDGRGVGACGCAGWRRRSTRWASRRTGGSPRSAGTPRRTWSSTSPRPCTGRVLHTLNIRLFPEQLVYIANHAEDDVVFVDRSLLPVFLPAAAAAAHGPARRRDRRRRGPSAARTTRSTTTSCSPRAEPFEGRFEIDDENSAAAMCYSSGTTGNPKGVVYSHRSTLLHSLITLTVDGAGPVGARRRDAGRADVPRQRVGPALRRAAGRRRAWCSPGRT